MTNKFAPIRKGEKWKTVSFKIDKKMWKQVQKHIETLRNAGLYGYTMQEFFDEMLEDYIARGKRYE